MCNSTKVIIIEGCDRVGKDSLISSLKSQFNNPMVIHSSAPTSNDLFNFYYNGLIHTTLDNYYSHKHDAVIHNRSMYGEYVYGPKYRSQMKSDIASMIYKLEVGQLNTFITSNDLYFILLDCDNMDLLCGNDDGQSISNKRSDIEDEHDAFNEIFSLSNIKNKLKVTVNHGNQFRSKSDIAQEVINFINHHNEG